MTLDQGYTTEQSQTLSSVPPELMLVAGHVGPLNEQGSASSATRLTKRQLEVLRLVAAGLSNKEIAVRLGLSIHTIESHMHAIYGKLGVTSRGAAIRYALDHGLA